MSPEYAMSGHFSVKSDVFSFGVLVLEVISGKKNWVFWHPDHDLNLIGHIRIQAKNNFQVFLVNKFNFLIIRLQFYALNLGTC